MKINPYVIKALYRIVANNKILISWEFDPRVTKKASFVLKDFLKEHGVTGEFPRSAWPHISLGLVESLTPAERNSINMAADAYKSTYKMKEIEILPGQADVDYISIKLLPPKEHGEFFQFLIDFLGDDRVDKPPSYPNFRPHASIITTKKEDLHKIDPLLPEMSKLLRRYLLDYTPDHLLYWKDFEVDEIYFAKSKKRY